jgi:hypothetical protein
LICVSVFYPHAPGKRFDDRLASHGITRYEIHQGMAAHGQEPPSSPKSESAK